MDFNEISLVFSCRSSLPCVHSRVFCTGAGAGRFTNRHGCADRRVAARIPRSAQRSPPARVVALDERQHFHRRHQARSRMDASRRRRRGHHLRRRHQHAAGGSAPPHLYDAGVEAGIQHRCDHRAQHEHGSGHRKLARMERDRRPVGTCIPGYEKNGLVGHARFPEARRSPSSSRIRHRWTAPSRIFRCRAAAPPMAR